MSTDNMFNILYAILLMVMSVKMLQSEHNSFGRMSSWL